jgi:DNA polymerase III delta prime subunit
VNQIGEEAGNNLIGLEEKIKQKLYGQNQVIETVLEKIYVAKAGLKSLNKPIGSFLFLGPTGTGKSEFAKLLSEHLEMKLVRFDMSEFESDKPFFITNPKSIKIKTEYMGKNSVLIAPESALNYAIENKFIAIPVRYGSEDANFSHVYFLSPILNKKLFIAALEQSWKIKLTYHQSNHN